MLYGSLFAGKLFQGGLFKGSLFGVGGSGPLAALIAALFGNDEQGGLWLPGPVDTFTDTAGTTAAVVTNTAARNNDRSPNAAHALQATADARPALGRTVEGGRRNLALESENLSSATAWLNTSTLNGSRTNGSFTLSDPEGYVYVRQTGAYNTAADHYLSFDVVCDTTISAVPIRHAGTTNASTLVNFVAGQTQRITIGPVRPLDGQFSFGLDARDAVVPGGSNAIGYVVTFDRVQYEIGSAATGYQRVGASALDVTEAGKPELYYLRDDGIDDSLVATFSASLGTACTTIIAHSGGITTLTGQTIGTTYDILQSTDVFGAIVVDRALTAGEQAMADAYLGGLHP